MPTTSKLEWWEHNKFARLFYESGAVKDGHFQYTSGRHGEIYIAKRVLYENEESFQKICDGLAAHFVLKAIDIVVGLETGGVKLSEYVARSLSRSVGRTVGFLTLPKRKRTRFGLRKGDTARVRGKRVLVVEDVVTTGGSLKCGTELVKEAGGTLAGVGIMWMRGKNIGPRQVGSPESLAVLVTKMISDYEPGEKTCQKCRDGEPLSTDFGHGRSAV